LFSDSQGELDLPSGEIVSLEGAINILLPCARSSYTDWLSWHFLRDGKSTKVFDSANWEIADGYSIHNSMDLLEISLRVLTLSEETAGEYTCIVHGQSSPSGSPQFDFGTVHLRIAQHGNISLSLTSSGCRYDFFYVKAGHY